MISGYIKTISELQIAIDNFVTSSALHGANAWVKLNEQAYPYGTTYKAKTGIRDGEYAFISISNTQVSNSFFHNWAVTKGNSPELQPVNGTFVANASIFSTTPANVLVATIHKQFMVGLEMFEQGGCFKSKCNGLVPQIRYATGNPVSFVNSYTIHPIADSASLGIKVDWLSPVKYILSLKNSSLTIILEFTKGSKKAYQVMSIGLLEAVDRNTYPFPAYFYSPTYLKPQCINIYMAKTKQHTSGYIIDYDPFCQSMGNSNLLFSTRMVAQYNIPPTVFNIMQPDGTWNDVYNYVQSYTLVQSGGEYVAQLLEPTRSIGRNFLHTVETDNQALRNCLNDKLYLYRPLVVLKDTYRGISGYIPNHYMTNTDTVSINPICLPNVFSDRIYHYSYSTDIHANIIACQSTENLNKLIIKED